MSGMNAVVLGKCISERCLMHKHYRRAKSTQTRVRWEKPGIVAGEPDG